MNNHQPTTDGDLLIEVGGVARRLGVCQNTVRNMEARGDIPKGMRLEQTGYRVWRLRDIEAVQARRSAAQTDDAP